MSGTTTTSVGTTPVKSFAGTSKSRNHVLARQSEVMCRRQQMPVIAINLREPLFLRTDQMQRIGRAEENRRRELLELLFHPIQYVGRNGKPCGQPDVVITLHDLKHQGCIGLGQLLFAQMAMHSARHSMRP